jgi:lipopolysaccharide/colanic/teichoic acid biosynthesis glycosyltransferase
MKMPGDAIAEVDNVFPHGQETDSGEAHGDVEAWDGLRLISVAGLLRHRLTVASLSEAREDASISAPAEWENISLAVHRLRTTCFQYRIVKRLIDVVVILGLLPVLVPLFLLVAAIVRVSSPGPILYRQRRVGQFGREFGLWKFRTMYRNGDEILREHFKTDPAAADEWAQSRKLRMDPRVTKLGNLLRRASLDELPQFLNVLAGSMSLVGPRPIVSVEKPHYRDEYFFYVSAKPGMSGLWQVSGRSDLSYHQRVALDEQYVRTWHLGLDMKILWRTAGAVWRAKGAV